MDKLDNVNIKNIISRSYEKIKKRILLAKYGILLNQICIDEGLYPIFTNIYIYIYIYIYICVIHIKNYEIFNIFAYYIIISDRVTTL